MKQEVNKTTVVVILVVVILAVVGFYAWKWFVPAGSGDDSPKPGTPESAAAAREQGRRMREDFMAARQRRGGPRGPGGPMGGPMGGPGAAGGP